MCQVGLWDVRPYTLITFNVYNSDLTLLIRDRNYPGTGNPKGCPSCWTTRPKLEWTYFGTKNSIQRHILFLYQLLIFALLFKQGGLVNVEERRRLWRCANDGQQVTDSLVNSVRIHFHVIITAAQMCDSYYCQTCDSALTLTLTFIRPITRPLSIQPDKQRDMDITRLSFDWTSWK